MFQNQMTVFELSMDEKVLQNGYFCILILEHTS